jgi:hypothetical protein
VNSIVRALKSAESLCPNTEFKDISKTHASHSSQKRRNQKKHTESLGRSVRIVGSRLRVKYVYVAPLVLIVKFRPTLLRSCRLLTTVLSWLTVR